MNIGIDIVKIKRINELMDRPEALRKIFQENEICDDPEKMAGILAVKEAYFKAMGKKGDWLDLSVKNAASGQPILIADEATGEMSLSISHDGDYAVAVVVIDGRTRQQKTGRCKS